MNSIETFSVIGYGGFGRATAENLVPKGAELLVCDHNRAINFPDHINSVSLEEAATADVVVAAVNYDSYRRLLPKLVDLVDDETLIVEVGSVKILPERMFERLGLLDRQNVLMSHPLFGPQSIEDLGLPGQELVVTRQAGERTTALLDDWRAKGVRVLDDGITADVHDYWMARSHALPSALVNAVDEMAIGGSPLATPYGRTFEELIKVESNHSAELKRTMQLYNPYAFEMRAALVATLLSHLVEIDHERQRLAGEEELMDVFGEYRLMINEIDRADIILTGQRYKVTDAVGELKPVLHLESRDAERERRQKEADEAWAIEYGVPPKVAVDRHRVLLDSVVDRHEEIRKRVEATDPRLQSSADQS